MQFGIGIYDALVNAHVSPEKAKAVVAELKREMMDELATKNDILLLKKDIENLALNTKRDFESFEMRLTIKLGLIVISGLGFITAVQKFLN